MAKKPTAVAKSRSAKTAWTSVEITRLLTSLLMPITVLLIGAYFTEQANERARERTKQDNEIAEERARQDKVSEEHRREDAKALETQRQDAIRIDGERRDELIRQENYRRERLAALEGYKRDDAARRTAIEAARYGKLIEMRAQIWDRIGPKITYIRDHIMENMGKNEVDHSKLKHINDEVIALIGGYEFYFSPGLINDLIDFITLSADYTAMREGGRRPGDTIRKAEEINDRYLRILTMMSNELFMEKGMREPDYDAPGVGPPPPLPSTG